MVVLYSSWLLTLSVYVLLEEYLKSIKCTYVIFTSATEAKNCEKKRKKKKSKHSLACEIYIFLTTPYLFLLVTCNAS